MAWGEGSSFTRGPSRALWNLQHLWPVAPLPSPPVLTAKNVCRYCPMSLEGQSHLQLRAPVLEAQRISAKIKLPSDSRRKLISRLVTFRCAFLHANVAQCPGSRTVLIAWICCCVTETLCSAVSVLCPVLHLFISRGILFIFLFSGSLLESLVLQPCFHFFLLFP